MIKLVQSADADKAKIVGLADRWVVWIVVAALSCLGYSLFCYRSNNKIGNNTCCFLPLLIGARYADSNYGGNRKFNKAWLSCS